MEDYTCEICDKDFTSTWSDEEADKEAEELFGCSKEDWKGGFMIVCDSCFKKRTL